MIVYWLLFFVPFLGVVSPARLRSSSQFFLMSAVGLLFAVFIGFRHEVGGDWFNYLVHLHGAADLSFVGALDQGDPGYYLLNWISFHLGLGIYGINFVCALIVMAGAVRFARQQPLPWLALLVAVPYLLVVVSMGYTRQSVALGFVLWALVSLERHQTRSFIFWVVVGAAFHKSAVLMLPLAALASETRRLWSFFWVGVISSIAAYFLVLDSTDALWQNYVETDHESQGALVRVLMNAVPAVLFIALRNRLTFQSRESHLWTWMAILAIACIPLVMISSTATDRVALYFIPLQLYVFSRLHLISYDGFVGACIVLAIVLYYAAVQAVWLIYASHADAWLPYQMYPFAS